MKFGGGIIWELSACKWQLKGREHNAWLVGSVSVGTQKPKWDQE